MTFDELKTRLNEPSLDPSGWHQHPNGGGWVRNTAFVKETAYVGPAAVIIGGVFFDGEFHDGVFFDGEFHDGEFHGGVFFDGVFCGGEFHDGEFHGGVFFDGVFFDGEFNGGVFFDGEFHAGVFFGGVFRGGEWKSTPLQIAGSRCFLNEAGPGLVQIGCHRETLDWWEKNGEALAKKEGFTDAQIAEYRGYLELFKKGGK